MCMLQAENLIVGAPCGIMDQLACSLGREGELLAILCQPGHVVGRLPIPSGLRFWALDSGAYHSVAGDVYSRVRTAAFMGLQYVKRGLQVRVCVSRLYLGNAVDWHTRIKAGDRLQRSTVSNALLQ